MWQNLRRQVQHELSTGIDLTRWVGSIGLAVAVGIAYFLAARLSLALLADGVAVFWPASGVAAGALIAYMLADHVITRDELFAVGATFTLVAWAFAYSYTVCQGPYRPGRSRHGHPVRRRWNTPLRVVRWSLHCPPRRRG